MEVIGDNFLTQLIQNPTRKGILLHLILTNKKEMITDMIIRDNLGCSYHEMVELKIPREENKTKSKTTTLDFRISLQRSTRKITMGYDLGEEFRKHG